jgi:hypothetical protein
MHRSRPCIDVLRDTAVADIVLPAIRGSKMVASEIILGHLQRGDPNLVRWDVAIRVTAQTHIHGAVAASPFGLPSASNASTHRKLKTTKKRIN